MKRLWSLFVILFSLCAPALAQSGVEKISKEISSRVDVKVNRASPKADELVHGLLSRPLTADSAVEVALLNNQSLQAILESWGIARAEFNRIGLPQNPVFEASIRFPEQDEPYNNTEFAIEQDFLSLILLPLRRNLAGAELHKAELEITKEVLDLIFEVKSAFYGFQGSLSMLSMRRRVLEQAEASQELAKRQFEAGNISELLYENERALYQDAKLEHLKAEADTTFKKQELDRLMGFGGEDPSWEIKEELRGIQSAEPSLDELFSMGLSGRLDLLIARKNIEALRHALSLNRFGVLGHPEVGVNTEKEVEGGRVTGPTLRTDVPIYDLGQTEVSRSGAVLKETELKLKALENDVRSEIKQKRDELFAIRALIEQYKMSIIPTRKKITEETQKHYNYMLLGNYDLIRAKQNEILAQAEYIQSLKEYWIIRSDLEKAISAKLALTGEAQPSEEEKKEPKTEMHHAHPGGKHA